MLGSMTGFFFGPLLIVEILLWLAWVAGAWMAFVKAGHPGWAAIIPFYNIWIILKIVGRPGWWLALYLLVIIPFFGELAVFVIFCIIMVDFAKSFGKSGAFAVGLILLSFIFMPIIGFGDAQYRGPAALQSASAY